MKFYINEKFLSLQEKSPITDESDHARYFVLGKFAMAQEYHIICFHSTKNAGSTTFEPDKEYTDYQWWLAPTAEGGWEIVSFGYGG